MNRQPIRVIFFDLGDTLVRAKTVSPSGVTFEWVQGAKDLLQKLRQADLQLGVISNTGTLTRSQLLQKMPADFSFDMFDQGLILLSFEIKIEKPDARIFRLAVNNAQNLPDPATNLQIDPWNCLFCGESLDECLVAQRVAMIAARVQLQPKPDIGRLANHLKDAGFLE